MVKGMSWRHVSVKNDLAIDSTDAPRCADSALEIHNTEGKEKGPTKKCLGYRFAMLSSQRGRQWRLTSVKTNSD